MLRLIYTLLLLTISSIGLSQVGNGVLFMTDAEYQFPGTTVDSTSTFEFQVVNDLGTPQTIFFSALDAPFSLLDNSPIEIPANDTASVVLQFQPTTLGTFATTLEAVGSVFGSANLSITGDGVQIILEWDPDTLLFDVTALGQLNTQIIEFSNLGLGEASLDVVEISNPSFTYNADESILSFEPGAPGFLAIDFSPLNSGDNSGLVTIETNDPDASIIQIPLSGMGISEISGELCDMILTESNSPYFLTGDILVPEGCQLALEEGVEVVGPEFEFIVEGEIHATGTSESNIDLTVKKLISKTSADFFILDFVNVNEQASYPYVNTLPYYDLSGENTTSGVYFENFQDGEGQGWYHEGPTSAWYEDGYYYHHYNGNGGLHNTYIYTPIFDAAGGVANVDYTFYRCVTSNYNYGTGSFQMSIDGGPWEAIWSQSGSDSNTCNDEDYSHNLLEQTSGASTVQFRWRNYFYDNGTIYVRNFNLEHAFSTGTGEVGGSFEESQCGMTLRDCHYNGSVVLLADSAALIGERTTFTGPELYADGLNVFSNHANISLGQCTIDGFAANGISIQSAEAVTNIESVDVSHSDGHGFKIPFGNAEVSIDHMSIDSCGKTGISVGSNSNMEAIDLRVTNNQEHGLLCGDDTEVSISFSLIDFNSFGIDMSEAGTLELNNSRLYGNNNAAIQSNSPTVLNHCNLAFNGGTGLVLTGNNFHTLNNSILWGNNETNYTQIDIGGGVISTSYSTVQGQSGYGVTGGGQFYWGEGVIEADPLFADDDLHLNTYSPCVDGGQPWLMDAHMPYGLGGVRADMGMYGGPDNAYWGGLALPDGASNLITVQDSPQDQGNSVGLTFSSSFYDNSELVNNVTHYAFWRHFDPTGAPITDVAEGNWELLGEMPSLSLNNYAYQAPTLGNTNAFGDFSSCYFVAAHTADDDTYWISNVMCGESVDNLAPDDPDLNGLVLETGEAQISWTPPTEEDYAYTEIYNDDGFMAEVGNDTLVLDPSVIPGYTYTYTAVNYDVNGNASDASSLTLEIPAGLDIIPLTAGWNLISTDRSASTPAIEDVLSSLDEGNVEYVTGFNNGVVLYEPDGFFIFNTLDEFESGFGYWIKVQEDDTLEIAGSLLTDGYMPSLNMGWNLIGYPNAENSSVETYFDQLLSDESLEYVTSFNQGSSYFDPNGLPFLNSLVELENGFGYWLKVSQAYDFNGLVTDQIDEPLAALSGTSGVTQPNPNYMLLNGTSNLAQEAGKQVLVHSLDGTIMGALPILEGGYLMTTALYGDDPATEALEGLLAGDEVYFSFEGKRSKEAAVYNGQMELRHINLEFEVQSQFEVFPNPFAEAITISGVLEAGGLLDAVITDSQGRMVAQRAAIEMTAGSYSLDWQLPRLAPGYYNCTVSVDGVTLDSMPIMHVEQ